MNEIQLSIVIPAYNEAERLPRYLESIRGYLGEDHCCEILVVDDGSSDATASVVDDFSRRDFRIKLVRLPANGGKGQAVRAGMLAASGKLLLFADADGATPIIELERLRQAVERGADVAIGSRAMRDDTITIRAHLHRKVMGGVFNFLVGVLAVPGIRDTQCGFKLFTREAADAVFPVQRIDGFGFDVELLFLCNKNGFSIAEIPVNWSDVKGSKVGLLRDSFRMFTELFKIRLNDLRGVYQPDGKKEALPQI